MYTVQGIATDNLLEEFESRVIHNSHMVGIPTYRTTYMKHQFGYEQQHGRNFISSTLRRMEVTRIDCYQFLVLHAITYTEFIRAHCIAFQTDTEYFRFQTVLHIFIFRSKNPVERVFKERSRVEIQFHPVFSRPLHPAFKMFHFHLVTVNKRTAEITVNFMQIQAMFARYIRSGL